MESLLFCTVHKKWIEVNFLKRKNQDVSKYSFSKLLNLPNFEKVLRFLYPKLYVFDSFEFNAMPKFGWQMLEPDSRHKNDGIINFKNSNDKIILLNSNHNEIEFQKFVGFETSLYLFKKLSISFLCWWYCLNIDLKKISLNMLSTLLNFHVQCIEIRNSVNFLCGCTMSHHLYLIDNFWTKKKNI